MTYWLIKIRVFLTNIAVFLKLKTSDYTVGHSDTGGLEAHKGKGSIK
jgi:hypothetical protein